MIISHVLIKQQLADPSINSGQAGVVCLEKAWKPTRLQILFILTSAEPNVMNREFGAWTFNLAVETK